MSISSELAPRRARLLAVSVFGLGYVGCVSAACLAGRGHAVIGVMSTSDKIELPRRGQSPVVEERIGELIAEVVGAGRPTVTADPAAAVLGSDVSIVRVGTPSASGGDCPPGIWKV
jgi:GDP-mannose 6-dehydrogenase